MEVVYLILFIIIVIGAFYWLLKHTQPNDFIAKHTPIAVKSEEYNVEKELVKLKNRKFRVSRVEYPIDNRIFFYAQIYRKQQFHEWRSDEYNNREWWGLTKDYYHGGFSADSEYGTSKPTEEEAIQLIEEYKQYAEKQIREEPLRVQRLKNTAEYLDKLKKERQDEALKNAPKITHKNL